MLFINWRVRHYKKMARRHVTRQPVRAVLGVALFAVLYVSYLYRKDWGGHWGGHLPSQLFVGDVEDKTQSPAWMGVGLPPPRIGEKHVRVVVRVHHLQNMATRSLIWSMRSQVEAAKYALPDASNFTVDVVLVATEEVGVPIVHKIAQGMTRAHSIIPFALCAHTICFHVVMLPLSTLTDMWNASDGFSHRDVFVANTSAQFFSLAKTRSDSYRCTEDDIKDWGAKSAICAYDNHAFYQATDLALFDVIHGCEWCTHVLVTNSDNTYHPNFLARSLHEGVDMVVTSFLHRGEYTIDAAWELARLDLGGVVFSKHVLHKVGGFIAALPERNSGAFEAHANDYYFVKKALKRRATSSIVPSYLFCHN